jgi:large subunit ribosomal protein L6
MSRIGKNPVPVPDAVKVALSDRVLTVEGPKGKLDLAVDPLLDVAVDEKAGHVTVQPVELTTRDPKQARHQRAMWGTTRKLIANMVQGVTEGYTRELHVVGVGYSAEVRGQTLALRCGFANEVEMTIPEGVTVEPPVSESAAITGVGSVPCVRLVMRSADKQRVGQFAAAVRQLRPPEPYKGKGIRYVGEEVKRKAGKALAAGLT